ncbi:MAG TPA: tRNA pseudouridine(55) synthase TruB [Thermomicrobiales bacterium]|jgi:tRNA pseudouridine55 synthase
MTATASRPGRLHGILVVDKPAGWTSHDVVARVRRLLGERHVGHAGTLDPAATGVLPLAVGDATKVLEYLGDASKTYLAEIALGVETDSHDLDGRVTRLAPITEVSARSIESALASLRGEIDQVPPMHSALKVGGRRLYELARAGQEIERAPRRITVFALDLIDWLPPNATVLVDCSKGTYVRAIARDLGDRVGVGAYLSNLVRLRTGPFTLDDAWTLAELAGVDFDTEWHTVAIHPDVAMADRPALIIGGGEVRLWRNGGRFSAEGDERGPVRVYDTTGEWLGVGRYDAESGAWRPVKVVGVAA